MTTERDAMLVKKVTYFGEFGYLNSSCLRKSIILMFLSSSTEVSVGFRPPPTCPVSIQISINLGETFLRISWLRKVAVT